MVAKDQRNIQAHKLVAQAGKNSELTSEWKNTKLVRVKERGKNSTVLECRGL